jgi:casein kinase II subunit beta
MHLSSFSFFFAFLALSSIENLRLSKCGGSLAGEFFNTLFPMSSGHVSWVDYFCSESHGRYFVKIESSYLTDNFNFFGLRGKTRESPQTFRYAIEAIRGPYIPPDRRPEDWPPDVEHAAVHLYGLLHARFLLSHNALSQMYEKYVRGEFPRCPRTCCDCQVCLPFGLSEEVGVSVLRMFCPRCKEVYVSDDRISESIDGAYFGSSWVHLFLQKYERESRAVSRGELKKPKIRLFGFKIEYQKDKSDDDDE